MAGFYGLSLGVLCVVLITTGQVYGATFSACYGKYFRDLSCPSGMFIKINGGMFGLSTCRDPINPYQCCPADTDCQIDMTTSNPEFLAAIREECDGRNRCGSTLRVAWVVATECGQSVTTDHVIVDYDCVSDDGTVATDAPDDSTDSGGGSRNNSTDRLGPISEHNGAGIDAAVIAGAVVGAVLLCLVLAILVLAIFIHKKHPPWAPELPAIKIKWPSPTELFKREKKPSPPVSPNLPRKADTTTRLQQGAINPAFRTESLATTIEDEWSGPYTGAQVVRTPQEAINAMKDEDTLDEEDAYDVIGVELSSQSVRRQPNESVKVDNDQRSSIPPMVAPSVPDVVPRQNSGVEQVTINDEVYYNPFNDTAEPQHTGDYVRPLQLRDESQYYDLKPTSDGPSFYDKMTPPQERGYLREGGSGAALYTHYLDVTDDFALQGGVSSHTEI